jgi:hypothetical protein
MEKVNVAYNLKIAESSMDLSTEAINTANQEEYIKKQEKFKRTVMGAYDICSKKLYKATDPTLEDYFRRKWKISRAQVYRFLDAAAVLKQLENFKYQPSHERLCRTLKQHAKIPEHMRLLWSKVLESAGDRLTSINSALVANVWNNMLSQGIISMKEVEEAAAAKKKRKGNKKQSANKAQKISKTEKKKSNTMKGSEASDEDKKLQTQSNSQASNFLPNSTLNISGSNVKIDIYNNTKTSQNDACTQLSSPSMTIQSTKNTINSSTNIEINTSTNNGNINANTNNNSNSNSYSSNNKLNINNNSNTSKKNLNSNNNNYIITTQQSIPTIANTIVSIPQNAVQYIPQTGSVITTNNTSNTDYSTVSTTNVNISNSNNTISSIISSPNYNTTVPPLTPPSQSPMIQQVVKQDKLSTQNHVTIKSSNISSPTNITSNNPSPNPTITSPYGMQQRYSTVSQTPIQMFPSYATNPSLTNTPPQQISQSSQIKNIPNNYNSTMTIPSPPVFNEGYNNATQSNTITLISSQLPTPNPPHAQTQILNSPNMIQIQNQVQSQSQHSLMVNSHSNPSPTMINSQGNYSNPQNQHQSQQAQQIQAQQSQSSAQTAINHVVKSGNQTPGLAMPIQYSSIVLQNPQPTNQQVNHVPSPTFSMINNNNNNNSNNTQKQDIIKQNQTPAWITYPQSSIGQMQPHPQNNIGPIQQQPTSTQPQPQPQSQPQVQVQAQTNHETNIKKNVVNLFSNSQPQTYYPNQGTSSSSYNQQSHPPQAPQQAISNTYSVYSISNPSQSSSSTQNQPVIYTPTNVQGGVPQNHGQMAHPQPSNIISPQQSSQNHQFIYTSTNPNNQNQNQSQTQIQPTQQTNIMYATSSNVQGGVTYVNQNQNFSQTQQTNTLTPQNPIYNMNSSTNSAATTFQRQNQGQNHQQPSYIYSNNMPSLGMENQNNSTYIQNINGNPSTLPASNNANIQTQMIPNANSTLSNPNSQNYYTTKSTYYSMNNISSQQMKDRANLNYILNK